MTLEVVEIVRRSQQGMTRPFLCRCDDDALYFVKGRDAGRKSLVSEWIAGQLALALDLPIAPFAIAQVPPALVSIPEPGLELADLGAGPAFASQRCEAMEINAGAIQQVPSGLRRDVLAFDWWIQNSDRYLTENGGNPNLFWEPAAGQLVVIDHNQAFDDCFAPDTFLDYHVFRDAADALFGDMLQRQAYAQRFAQVLATSWPAIVETLPEEWFYLDQDMLDPVAFDVEDFRALLARCQHNDFWCTS